jgi:hypothetical protein
MEMSKKLFEAAVYASIDGPDIKDWKEHSKEWQEGYKKGHHDSWTLIFKNINYFSECINLDLIRLMELDIGFWNGEDKIFALNMNDQFAWALADCEEVEEKYYKEVLRLYDLYGLDGLLYWAAEKRGYDPDKNQSEGHERNWKAVQEIRAKEKMGS